MKNFIWHTTETKWLNGNNEWKLATMFTALKDLGNPQKALEKNVIHIAGTNGKGSTASYIKTVLEYAGYKIGVFTSPHLVEYNERIYANGKYITDGEIEKYKQKILTTCSNTEEISFFEATTLIAILFFSDLQKKGELDYCIFEVGLGGRLDATNVFQKPLVSVITSISFDHMDKLGNTLAKIAIEKGGIIKPNVPVFTSNTNNEVINELQKIANEKQTKLFHLGKDFVINKNLKPSLAGEHQLINATLASEVCKFIGIDYDIIKKGIADTEWNGRLQKIHLSNINEHDLNISNIYLDGAHNEDGIRVLCQFINQQKINNKDANIIGIFACLERKDYQSFFSIFQQTSFDNLLFLKITDNEHSFVSTSKLHQLAEHFNIQNNEINNFTDLKNYVDKTKNNIIFIFGSLYFVGIVIDKYMKK